jgi:hypothetical protein
MAMPSSMPGAGSSMPPMGAPPSGMGGPPPSIGNFAFPKPQVMAVPPFGGGGVAPFGVSSSSASASPATSSETSPALAPAAGSLPPQSSGPGGFAPAPHPFGFPAPYNPAAPNVATEYTEPTVGDPVVSPPPSEAEPAVSASTAPPGSMQTFGEEALVAAPPAWPSAPAEPSGQPEWL